MNREKQQQNITIKTQTKTISVEFELFFLAFMNKEKQQQNITIKTLKNQTKTLPIEHIKTYPATTKNLMIVVYIHKCM